jgi:hypothetical protein
MTVIIILSESTRIGAMLSRLDQASETPLLSVQVQPALRDYPAEAFLYRERDYPTLKEGLRNPKIRRKK